MNKNIETKPYNQAQSKKAQVQNMFDNIASNYDFLNRVLSFGIDIYWRKVLVKRLKKQRAEASGEFKILDIATGTADLPLMIVSRLKDKMKGVSIDGVDLSTQMLSFGQIKVDKAAEKNPAAKSISLSPADAEALPFEEKSFDAVTAVFGVRNFENKALGLEQMHRVLRGGGRLYILEFGMPDNKIIGALYSFYFHRVLPAIGGLISRDFKAYDYLPKSVESFPAKDEFCGMMTSAGFDKAAVKSLTFGVANLYSAQKK